MNTPLLRPAPRLLLAFPAMALAALLLVMNMAAIAAPGAHGPDGEHLDGPPAMRAASALPRVEANSEAFELVAELRGGELAIVVDRFETNEPVLGAKLEVETGALKAVAAFRAEQGDYAVTDAALLKALAAPGEHGLVFTLVAGQDSDLLDGTLVSRAGVGAAAAARNDHGHAHGGDDHLHDLKIGPATWAGVGVAFLGLVGAIAWLRLRRGDAGQPRGGL